MRDPLKFTEPNRLVLQYRVAGSTTDIPQWKDYASIKTSEDLFTAQQKCRGDYLGFRIQDSEDGYKTVYPPYSMYLKALINYKLGSIISLSDDTDQQIKMVYDLVCAIEKPTQIPYVDPEPDSPLEEAIMEAGVGDTIRRCAEICMHSEGAGNGYIVGACLAVLAEVEW